MDLFDLEVLNTIGKSLLKKKQTIAVAESVSSGLLQAALSSIPNESGFYHGGITAYNLAQKYRHLRIEPIHAKSVNCVSQKVADDMALGVCALFGSDWGISITGYATPVPESGNKIFAHYAIAFQGKIKAKGRLKKMSADSIKVQLHYVNTTIARMKDLL
jgi:PncC family amidohydrolase